MDKERWQRIQELFHSALDLPEDDRAGFVQAECGDDAEMRHEVMSLLEADSRELSLLDGDAVDVLGGDIELEDATGLEGERVGPYKIVERI
ncbi:MAG: hypothetical protein PVF33_12220, partial [Candidatus Latescibacterota bacterium]